MRAGLFRDAVDFVRNFADRCHHAKEEGNLCPRLEARGLPSQDGPVAGTVVASAGGHGMMWGPAVARIAVDLTLHGATAVTDVSFLGLGRFDAAGRSSLAADPIALPFPTAAGP